MTNQKKYPGTPAYHSMSTRNGRQATHSVTRQMRIPAEIERENQTRAFKAGLVLGIGIASLVFGLILWLWVIPTMDAAVATAQGMVS